MVVTSCQSHTIGRQRKFTDIHHQASGADLGVEEQARGLMEDAERHGRARLEGRGRCLAPREREVLPRQRQIQRIMLRGQELWRHVETCEQPMQGPEPISNDQSCCANAQNALLWQHLETSAVRYICLQLPCKQLFVES